MTRAQKWYERGHTIQALADASRATAERMERVGDERGAEVARRMAYEQERIAEQCFAYFDEELVAQPGACVRLEEAS